MIGKKIYLRILEKSDVEATQKWINDPFISDVMGYLPVLSFENQLAWFDEIKNDRTRFIFAISLIENNMHIGNVGLGKIDYISRNCMFNIFIAEKGFKSKGLGTEATFLALSFAFDRLNMNKVYLQTSERFVEANKMYRRIGFKKEGTLREHYYSGGKYEDKIIFSLLRKEYYER